MATSVPTISAELHSASGYFWIGGAYLLANAAVRPIWARCSDIWGRKPAILVAIALFAGASVMAALSVSMRMLIAARALQGTAGGGLLQLVIITISDLFSIRSRTLYLGLLEVMWAVAGGAGPLVSLRSGTVGFCQAELCTDWGRFYTACHATDLAMVLLD